MAAIKLMSLNVGSLIGSERKMQLQNMLISEKVDIALIQETHLKEGAKLFIPGYSVLKNNEKQGTAIIYKKEMRLAQEKAQEVEGATYCASSFKCEAVRTLLISIYIQNDATRSDCDAILQKLKSHSDKFEAGIIGGDLNTRYASWDSQTNSRGRALADFLDTDMTGLIHILPTEPTYIRGSLIDHFLVSCKLTNWYRRKIGGSFSDHLPFYLELDIRNTEIQIPRRVPYYNQVN